MSRRDLNNMVNSAIMLPGLGRNTGKRLLDLILDDSTNNSTTNRQHYEQHYEQHEQRSTKNTVSKHRKADVHAAFILTKVWHNCSPFANIHVGLFTLFHQAGVFRTINMFGLMMFLT